MKKMYLRKMLVGLIILTLSNEVVAQRVIDWSVDEIIKPTEMRSSDSTTSVEVESVLKLVSGDSAMINDTLIFALILNDPSDGSVILRTVSARVLDRVMKAGDTMHLKATWRINAWVSSSIDVIFQHSSVLINRGPVNPISPEPGANDANAGTNNWMRLNLVWYNPQGWGVSVANLESANKVELYPNPATSEVSFAWHVAFSNEKSTIRIYDLEGRLVITRQVWSSAFKQTVDISDLKAGVYVVEMNNGDVTTSKKLQVLK